MMNIVRFSIFQYLPNDMRACPVIHVWKYCQSLFRLHNLAEMGITLNKCSREEHVPVAERSIRILKERCRCISNTLPFQKLPGMLIVQMVSTCNFWLNIYPPKDGVSRNINPQELITGVQIDYNKHIRAEFGESMNNMTIP
jgi:hypothetical protein